MFTSNVDVLKRTSFTRGFENTAIYLHLFTRDIYIYLPIKKSNFLKDVLNDFFSEVTCFHFVKPVFDFVG